MLKRGVNLSWGRKTAFTRLDERPEMSSPQRSVSTSLPSSPRSAQLARHLVDDTLLVWNQTQLKDTAELLTTELVANAVRHAESPLSLRVIDEPGAVRVEVLDRSNELPRPVKPAPGATSGRGLVLVDTLATEWGVERMQDGKCVWFRLAYAPLAHVSTPLG